MSERDIFSAALEMTDPAARSVYLDQACAGDAALRRRVEMLLGTHGSAGDFLERPAAEQMAGGAAPPPDATAALDPAGRPEPASPPTEPGDDEADAPLAFLQPSTKPGSLGRLGHYEVLEVLGRGGFGIVLKAFDEMLHRVVAVKVMAPQLAATSPARKRFLREARASAAIRHENVVAIYNVEEQPIPYLVMEFIAGETVQQRLDRTGPLDAPEVARIGRQIAEGLAAAHAMGLIHRDVKPANILLESGADRVKITDFGLARAADDASLTQSGVIAGTPMYMAPEQARGETIDHRADLFSLGSVLYVMCSGRPPFRASTTMAVLKRVAEDAPRPIREIIPEAPEWLCAIIAKLHAKKPEERFASAKEVADLLARCLAELQRSGNVSPLPPGPATPQRSQPPREIVAPSPAAARARRSGRRWMASAAALLLLLVGLGVTEFTGRTHLAGALLRLFHPKREVPPMAEEPPPLAVAPFDAPQAWEYQAAWAKHLHVPVEAENSIGMKLRLIPPGEFLMGSSQEEKDEALKQGSAGLEEDIRSEEAPHRVRVGQPFFLGECPVTVGQFRQFVAATGYRTSAETNGKGGMKWDNSVKGFVHDPKDVWSNPSNAPSDENPVCVLALADVQAFCDWLGAREGLRYASPAEEQWEYACRAGTTGYWCSGDDPKQAENFGWFGTNAGGIVHPVRRKLSNAFGLFDMHGDINELVRNAEGQTVMRGGLATLSPWNGRSASRSSQSIWNNQVFVWVGFRVAVVGNLSKLKQP